MEPPTIGVSVCTEFEILVGVNAVEPPVHDYEFWLTYDPTQMTPVTAEDMGFLQPTVLFGWEVLYDYQPGRDAAHCWAVTTDGGSTGVGYLAHIIFHCDALGASDVILSDIFLSDEYGIYWDPTVSNSVTHVNQYIPDALAWIDPPDYTVPVCIPFPVTVMVDIPIGFNLNSFQLVLHYDTTFVDCINIVPGDFPPLPRVVDHKLIDDTLGLIEFDVTAEGGGGSEGSGSIAELTFHCTGAGESIMTISSLNLYTPEGWLIPVVPADGRVIQREYWEPLKLQHLVELPYSYHLADLPFVPPSSAEGYAEIKTMFEAKGYVFDVDYGGGLYNVDSFFDVYFEPGSEPFEGQVCSWWSNNTLEDGTRACLLTAEWEDGSSIAMGFVTNLLPPEQIPEIDPYIIYNAEPYFFIDYYWWAWHPIGQIIRWPYWWHNSHNHPNWFWGPYWWWRTYTKAYYYPYTVIPYWRPWWGWWWHWVYWKHWYWWSSYFPYDP